MLFLPEFAVLITDIIRNVATHPSHLIAADFVGGFSGNAFFPVITSLILIIDVINANKEELDIFSEEKGSTVFWR